MSKELKPKVGRAVVVDKLLARAAWFTLHTFHTAFPQDVHEVVRTLWIAMGEVKGGAREEKWHFVSCCFRLGAHAGANGHITFPVSLPDRIKKRWKLIAFKAVQAGIKFARSKY